MNARAFSSWFWAPTCRVQGASIIGPGPGHSAKDARLIITPSVTAPDGFLAHSYCGDDALECKDFVRSQLGLPQFKPSEPQAAMTARLDALETPNKNIEPARRIWRESGPLIGGIAERYLNSRKLALDPAEDWHRVLRFHPNCPFGEERAPAMIALMRDILTDEPSCIQRTRLTPDGLKIDRQMLGPAKGAAVKIDADADVTQGIVIGEGAETCIAARQLGLRPVWALGSAGAIASFPVLRGIDGLTILAEAGEASAKAIKQCGNRWHEAGIEVIVADPLAGSDIKARGRLPR